MAIPAKFLVEWNKTVETWGSPAKMFVHEWAKLRYGIFDEFGFPGKSAKLVPKSSKSSCLSPNPAWDRLFHVL